MPGWLADWLRDQGAQLWPESGPLGVPAPDAQPSPRLQTCIVDARALIRTATQNIAISDDKRRVSAAHTAYWCLDKLKKVPEGCMQVFGGIGFTWEHDIHLYLRRTATLASLLGEQAEHREVVVNHLDTGAL